MDKGFNMLMEKEGIAMEVWHYTGALLCEEQIHEA